MPQNLDGKVAVITGAASGMGRGTAEAFVSEGARVVIADIQDDLGNEVADRLGDDAIFVHTDVTKEADIESVIAAAVSKFGRLDVMFNNAGAGGDPAAMLDSTPEGFARTMSLLAGAAVLGHRYAARQFIAQGGGGSIITTSSIAGLEGGWAPVGYTAAKTAILGIVRTAAAELGPLGIRSNAIVPGTIATPIIANSFGVPADRAEAFTKFVSIRLDPTQPLGRVGQPSDIAGAAVFLASELSSFITGTSIVVDGGMTAVTGTGLPAIIVQAATEFAAQ